MNNEAWDEEDELEGELAEMIEEEDDDSLLSYRAPSGYAVNEDPNRWHGWLPPAPGTKDPIYIEGIFPNTVLTRRAMELVPKKLRKDPLIGLKESQENLLRICIRQIGTREVTYRELQGKGLDRLLTTKQMHFVAEHFERITMPEEAEVNAFLATIRTGAKK